MIFKKKNQTTVLVSFSDTHPNSRVGLCHPKGYKLGEDGGRYEIGHIQEWLWENWIHFWKEVKKVAIEEAAQVIAVCVGDGADDNTHSKAGLITLMPKILVQIGVDIWEPVKEVAKEIHLISGTKAHVGIYATHEESIGEKIGVIPDLDTGMFTSFRRRIRVRGVTFDCQHRPVSNATRFHTQGAGARRTAFEICGEYWGRKEELPQVALRGHFHHPGDSGDNYPTRCFFNPAWKLHGEWEQNRGYRIQPVGGWIFICRNGQYHARLQTYEPERGSIHECHI